MSEEICKNCKYHYTEEISFDYPQSCCNKTNPNHTTEEWFHCDCFEYSKNYITNLQQKVEKLEKENKILKENAEHNDKVVDKVNWENMLLKRKNKEIDRLINLNKQLVEECQRLDDKETRLNNIISEFENKGYDIAQEKADFLLEIERLNNIINELEKYLKENIKLTKTAVHFEILDDYDTRKYKRDIALFEMVLDKLKELKDSD